MNYYCAAKAITGADAETSRLIGRHICLVKALERDEAIFGSPANGGSPTLFIDWDRLHPCEDAASIIVKACREYENGRLHIAAIFLGQMPNTTITQSMPLLPSSNASSKAVFFLDGFAVLEPYPVRLGLSNRSKQECFRASSDAMLLSGEFAKYLRTVKVQSLDESINCLHFCARKGDPAPWKDEDVVYQINPPPFRSNDSRDAACQIRKRFNAKDPHVHVLCKPCKSQGLSNRINCICGAALLADALGVLVPTDRSCLRIRRCWSAEDA